MAVGGHMTTYRLRHEDPTSLDLIEEAKRGSASAWEQIYGSLAGPVTGYLRSRGAADAEDLSSEVFLQVARDIHRFDGDADKFRSWVFVIAHRRLIDARRRASRRPVLVEEAVSQVDESGGDVEEEVMSNLGTAWMREVFESLTDEQQQVLSLRIIADLSLEDTAAVMGKRVGAVKALQRRALGAVRPRLVEGGVS
jgi:RNA polymerase sigma-70 factor (ECF subfamily)